MLVTWDGMFHPPLSRVTLIDLDILVVACASVMLAMSFKTAAANNLLVD